MRTNNKPNFIMTTLICLEMNGKPHFSPVSPQILVQNLQYSVEVGSYVSFYHQNSLRYGRIVKSFVAPEDNIVMVTLNRYFTTDEVQSSKSSITLPPPMSNRFVGVSEIFASSHCLKMQTNFLHGIIFVFKLDVCQHKPYEGSKNIFCMRYKL